MQPMHHSSAKRSSGPSRYRRDDASAQAAYAFVRTEVDMGEGRTEWSKDYSGVNSMFLCWNSCTGSWSQPWVARL